MKQVEIIPLKKEIKIQLIEGSVNLSAERQKEIEEFWKEINMKEAFHRGEVFHVHSITEKNNSFIVHLLTTDYAHYLHTFRNKITDREGCKVIFGAGLVETLDGKYVFGEMGHHTASPGRAQCAGGGLSWDDLKENHFDLKGSVLRELQEELGIKSDSEIEDCSPVFIKTGGDFDFVVILYHIKISCSSDEFLEKYRGFTSELAAAGKKPEFQKIICLEKDREKITEYFHAENRYSEDYLHPFLEKMLKFN